MPRRALALAVVVAIVASPGDALHGQEREASRPRVFRTEHGGPALRVVGRARVGNQPKSVEVSPDGTRVITCNFGRPDAESVAVLDAFSLARVGTIEFVGNAVESVFTRDGATLYVSNFREHRVEVIDFSSCYGATESAPCAPAPRAEIAVGRHPKWMALSPDEATLYVANYADRSVSVVDVATLTETRRLPTLRHPRGMAVRPDGTLLAAAFHGDVIHVFGAGEPRERERWEACEYPRHIVMSPDGATAYVTCSMGHVGFYDATSGRRFGIGVTGRNPRSIDLSTDGRYVAVANFTSSDVSLVDTDAHTHRTYEIERASGIVGVALHPGGGVRMYATSWDTNEVVMLTDAVAEAAHATPAEAMRFMPAERRGDRAASSDE
jgi:YVTN family beta-propeller protein